MKTSTILALLLAICFAGAATAQDLKVDVEPVVEGKAEPGKDWTFKLRFSVPEGYHAYHRDNPEKVSVGMPIGVTFSQLSGLVEKSQTWPEPKKHKTASGEEWELSGDFDIAWTFTVPAGARGTLAISGVYEVQFCDEKACYISDGMFDAHVEVNAPVAPAEPIEQEDVPPSLTATAAFEGGATAGGKAVLAVTFEAAKGWHAYHKDNPGSGMGLKVKLSSGPLKLTGESWPEPKKIDRWGLGTDDWEYEGKFVVKYTFDVPADAEGEVTVQGSFEGQVCIDMCVEVSGKFSAAVQVAKAVPPKAVNDAKDKHGFYVDFDYAMSEARRLNKPLLVDFNGKFCPPCRAMEATVFTLDEVKKLFESYVIVSLITDVKDETANGLWANYKPSPSAGVPYYAVLDHDGKLQRGIGSTLPAKTHAVQFIAFLKGEPIPEISKEAENPAESTSTKPAPQPQNWPKDVPAPKPADLDSVFDFESVFTAPSVKPGSEVTLELRFALKTVETGKYRMYHPASPHAVQLGGSLFMLETISVGGLEPVGDWQYPEPEILPKGAPGNNFDADEWKFYGKFSIVRKFRVPANSPDGTSFQVSGSLAGQYCDDRVCVWFTDMDQTPFGWVASVTAAASGADNAISTPFHGDKQGEGEKIVIPAPGEGGLASDIEKSGGLFWFLLGVFGLGMLTLLTPCVLPVLPLTVAFFVKQAEQGRSPLTAAVIYCGCIVGVFTLFGLITSLILGEQGAQIISTNAWVNIGIGVLFTVFALSFFGLFELRMPTFLSAWVSRRQMNAQQQGKGYLTALLSGGSFAIISFSCTGPIAASLLAGVATGVGSDQSVGMWIPALAMFVFASGLALPIFVLGQFPNMLKRMPKSGGWMNAVKVVFAFIEIAVAIRYFSWAEIAFTEEPVPQWINRNLVDAVWIACSVGAGLYLLGLFRMPHDHERTEQIGVVRMLIAMVFLSFGLYMTPGLVQGAPMGYLDGFLPPREVHAGSGTDSGDIHALNWTRDLDEGLARAQVSGKPVFVDFTGVICANCRWVETNIFPKPAVIGLLETDFELVQQWTDVKSDQKAKDNYRKYGQGEKGVPMYVVVDPQGNMLERFVPPQFINSLTADQFADFLKSAKSKMPRVE